MSEPTPRLPYPNPPITEVLIEFEFAVEDGGPAPHTGGDPTLPGALHQRLYESYPKRPEYQAWTTVGSGSNQVMQLQAGGIPKVMLSDVERHRLLLLGAKTLSVHSIPQPALTLPYEGWARLRARAQAALQAYEACRSAAAVVRVGVRYINRITIPTDQPSSVYLSHLPRQATGLADATGFELRTLHPMPEGRLIVTTASLAPDADLQAVGLRQLLLDLDLSSASSGEPMTPEAALRCADALHLIELSAFKAIVTQEAEVLFQ